MNGKKLIVNVASTIMKLEDMTMEFYPTLLGKTVLLYLDREYKKFADSKTLQKFADEYEYSWFGVTEIINVTLHPRKSVFLKYGRNFTEIIELNGKYYQSLSYISDWMLCSKYLKIKYLKIRNNEQFVFLKDNIWQIMYEVEVDFSKVELVNALPNTGDVLDSESWENGGKEAFFLYVYNHRKIYFSENCNQLAIQILEKFLGVPFEKEVQVPTTLSSHYGGTECVIRTHLVFGEFKVSINKDEFIIR